MSRPGKIVLGFVGTLIVLAIIAVAVVFTNLNRLLKYGVEEYGPSITGTAVSLNEVDVSPFSGKGELHGLEIGNPEGFEGDYAFKLDGIKVQLVPETLRNDTVVVKEILIGGARLHAQFKGTKSNLQQILDNVKKSSGASAEAEQPGEAQPTKAQKFIVKEFRFTGGEVTASSDVAQVSRTAKIPAFEVQDIGNASGGVTAAELTEQLLRPMIDKALEKAQSEVLKQGTEQFKQKAQEKLRDKLKGLTQ